MIAVAHEEDSGDRTQANGAADQGVPRLVTAGAEEALARFSDPELLASGRANVISLQAVEARFGARWRLRADQVHAFAERVFERGMEGRGFFVRISATDYFVVQPSIGRATGQAACLRYLREVLQHFLGEDSQALGGVLQVTQIENGRLLACQIEDLGQVSDAEPTAQETESGTVAKAVANGARLVDRWTPFVAADGRELRVSARLEPVYELKGFTRIGFRLARKVIIVRNEEELSPQQIGQLSTADLLRVDLATIARGMHRLLSDGASERQHSLIVPLSYPVVSNQKARTELAKQIREAGALVKSGVICEICDIEGVPAGALMAVAALIKPFALLILGRVSDTSTVAMQRLEGAGLQALSLDSPQGLSDQAFLDWATSTIAAARAVSRSILVYQVDAPRRAGILASIGASHVSVANPQT